MYTRQLNAPRSAFFLFGPRGTGKSTWLRTTFADPLTINLLPASTSLRYLRDPALFRAEVMAQPRERWIAVDQVQRVPALLDEVHWLMEEAGYRRFVLTGSSGRKLKRGAANLLAGRAVVKHMFPLTTGELSGTVPIPQRLRYGSLPLSVTAPDDTARARRCWLDHDGHRPCRAGPRRVPFISRADRRAGSLRACCGGRP